MKQIKLTQGQVALVDDEDFESLSKLTWHVAKGKLAGTYYAEHSKTRNGEKINLRMHRVIMSAKKGEVLDHINRNPLDNRKMNLRFVTYKQNASNKSMRSDNSSGYIGVVWDKDRNKWRSQITHNGVAKNLGRFTNIIAAAKEYNHAAKEMFGEFAVLNVIRKRG